MANFALFAWLYEGYFPLDALEDCHSAFTPRLKETLKQGVQSGR